MKLKITNLQKVSSAATVVILVSLLISFVVLLGFTLPNYESWRTHATENIEAKAKLQQITQNINAVESLDSSEIESFIKLTDLFLPRSDEPLRFASLAEKVAAASKMSVSSAQVQAEEKSKSSLSTSLGANASSDSSNQPNLSSDTGSATNTQLESGGTSPSDAKQADQQELLMKISFKGLFPSLFLLLDNFGKTDRAATISKVNISSVQSEEEIIATINFRLPVFSSQPAAGLEQRVDLPDQDREFLRSLAGKVKITAPPSKKGVGRSDPFN